MFSGTNDYKKNVVSIPAFGGYNHTDTTRLGEWHDMCNISGDYYPLLTPRRSREIMTNILNSGSIRSLIYKDGYYLYSLPSGIICEAGAMQPIHISEHQAPYVFIEMGAKIFAFNGSDNGIMERDSAALNTWTFTPIVNFEARATARDNNGNLFEPKYYYLYTFQNGSYGAAIKNDSFTTIGNQVGIVPGTDSSYHNGAADMLNIAFRFCVQDDKGKYKVLNITTTSTDTDVNAMANSGYYISSGDKKLYYYDKPSGAKTEVTAPKIAIFIRNGIKSDGNGGFVQQEAPQSVNVGDYIKLQIGAGINCSHPFSWRSSANSYTFKTNISWDSLLRVLHYHEYSEQDNTIWNTTYGWQYYYIVDYSAAFVEWICENNLVCNTEHYSRRFESGTTSTVTFVNQTPEQGDITADALQLPSVGTNKFYPSYIKIAATVPGLSSLLEHNNRVWGANNANNEIKASAQGNFRNWDDYRGLVSDSYAVSVGSDGDFTASCAIDEYLFFFKEHSYTMLYGTRPANFCTNTVTDFIGMSNAASLQVIGKSAYYMGIDGKVYRFNGSDSICISAALGDERYTPIASCHSQDKYYLLLQNTGGKKLFSYNIKTGMWFAEDGEDIDTVLNLRAHACALCTSTRQASGVTVTDTQVLILDKWNIPAVENNTVEWWCESGVLGLESDFYQFISNLKITFESEVGAELEVLAKYDSDLTYTPLARFISKTKGTRSERIRVKRCEFMRLKLRGKGFSKVFRISYMTEQGSEK